MKIKYNMYYYVYFKKIPKHIIHNPENTFCVLFFYGKSVWYNVNCFPISRKAFLFLLYTLLNMFQDFPLSWLVSNTQHNVLQQYAYPMWENKNSDFRQGKSVVYIRFSA
jgi:hypothetical protein